VSVPGSSDDEVFADEVSDADVAHLLAEAAGAMVRALREDFDSSALRTRDGSRALRDAGDQSAHEFLMDRLAYLRPGDAVLSEEGADDPAILTAERLWIVDPLDGTWEYGQGRDDWAVHVALWEHGELVAGAVSLPCSDLTYSTSPSRSARSSVSSEIPTSRPIRIAVSRTRAPSNIAEIAAGLEGLTDRRVELVPMGSAGAKAGEVLAGRVDVYLHDSGLSEWDVAAPAVVAVAAGCLVWRFDGSQLRFNQWPPLVDGLVISAPGLAPYVREVLNEQ